MCENIWNVAIEPFFVADDNSHTHLFIFCVFNF